MVFAKPKVVKKPLKTIWCLDQSEVQDQSEEKERTSVGFLSSGRKANLSELELDDIFEEELEMNSLAVGQHDSTEDQSEITLEKEFVEFVYQNTEYADFRAVVSKCKFRFCFNIAIITFDYILCHSEKS